MAKGDEESRIADAPVISTRTDEVLETLARLIGRQMAREQAPRSRRNKWMRLTDYNRKSIRPSLTSTMLH